LPIVFHFKGDVPANHILGTPEGDGRMASRIILKPLPVSQSTAVPILLLLRGPGAPAILELREADGSVDTVSRGTLEILRQFIDGARNHPKWKKGKVIPL
jgi:CRISPR/Cas system CMR-associated protein Cmr1 (group 7 of RAMP superfamily)